MSKSEPTRLTYQDDVLVGDRVLEGWGKFWLIYDKNTVSIPDYIKGTAKGTIKEYNGFLLRQVTPTNKPLGWHFADDLEKRTIPISVYKTCKRYVRDFNYVAGLSEQLGESMFRVV